MRSHKLRFCLDLSALARSTGRLESVYQHVSRQTSVCLSRNSRISHGLQCWLDNRIGIWIASWKKWSVWLPSPRALVMLSPNLLSLPSPPWEAGRLSLRQGVSELPPQDTPLKITAFSVSTGLGARRCSKGVVWILGRLLWRIRIFQRQWSQASMTLREKDEARHGFWV